MKNISNNLNFLTTPPNRVDNDCPFCDGGKLILCPLPKYYLKVNFNITYFCKTCTKCKSCFILECKSNGDIFSENKYSFYACSQKTENKQFCHSCLKKTYTNIILIPMTSSNPWELHTMYNLESVEITACDVCGNKITHQVFKSTQLNNNVSKLVYGGMEF